MKYKMDYIKTMPEIFEDAMSRGRNRYLYYYKQNKEWKSLTYGDLQDNLPRIGFGLRSLGLVEGDKVGILSENRPEWSMVDWTCSHFRFVSVPIYQTSIARQIEYIANHSESKVIFVSSREQAEKLISIRNKLKHLEYIVIFDDEDFDQDRVLTFDDLKKLGDAEAIKSRISMKGITDSISPDDLWSIIYTSGTSGDPKGVMISHFNIAANIQQTQAHAEFKPDKRWLSFLPLSHSFERLTSLFTMWIGAQIYFAESITKVAENLKEVRPQYMTTVPRLLEKIYAAVIDKMANESDSTQKIFNWAVGIGQKAVEKSLRFNKQPKGILGIKYTMAKSTVFNKIADIFGGKFVRCISGGAPLSKEIGEFFAAAGIRIQEGYGLTEMSPITHGNYNNNLKFGTVGAPYVDVQTNIMEDGEICLKGPNMMHGYYKSPELTAEAIDKDGWFHTGDIGFIDEDGYLKITDRKKNLIVTAGGKNIAPAGVEREITSSKFIDQAVVIGDKQRYLVAILVPSVEILQQWGEKQSPPVKLKSYADIATSEAVRELIQSELDKHQVELARFEQIKYFFIPPHPFTIENGDLTASMKIKRNKVIEKYHEEIDKMYNK